MHKIKRVLFLVLLILLTNKTFTQDLQSSIATKAMAIQSKLVEWRRHLHQNPEW